MKNITFDPDGDLRLLLRNPVQDAAETSEVGPDENVSEELGNDLSGLVIPEESLNSNDVALKDDEDCSDVVEMLVSSKHMMLASKVFKAMLSNFSEGYTLRSTGKVEQTLPEDDPAAFEILLNIIHGRTRSVPRQVDLPLLARLAITTDKYELWEVVEMFSDVWITHLQDSIPKSFSKDLHLWLLISWVFGKPSEFSHVSKVLQKEASGRIEGVLPDNLPIPPSIIGMGLLIPT
jgi:BTB/POZ domain